MIILGLTHPVSWNNAACILVDGQLIAMAEEERFNRIKHAPRMVPTLAIDYCLKQANLKPEQVDYVAIGWEKLWQSAFKNLGSDNILSDLNLAGQWLYTGLKYERQLPLAAYKPEQIIFVNHHIAHAASAYLASGFPEANILSLDGSGGSESGMLAVGRGPQIDILNTVTNRGSWGLMYELITETLGFRRHSGEGKVMGLAAYGEPDPAGLPCVDWDQAIPMIIPHKRKAFMADLEPRKKHEPLTAYHKNLAATLQNTLERAGQQMVEWLYQQTGLRRLCLAGGTALNCSMNGKLAALNCVDEIFIQPAAHDAGTALGAALNVYVQKTGQLSSWRMQHAYWGPDYTNEAIEKALHSLMNIHYHKSDDICAETAELLAAGKIIGWFQGRAEIGPRALGCRSILAHPALPDMKDLVNKQVKHREPWRPFAPSILADSIDRYVEQAMASPYMILAFAAKKDTQAEIISATHVDGTCRPQTVNRETNERYWTLIKQFERRTGIPALLNTSFNVDSQPIVNTPQEAIETFLNCGLDHLAIGDYLVHKSN